MYREMHFLFLLRPMSESADFQAIKARYQAAFAAYDATMKRNAVNGRKKRSAFYRKLGGNCSMPSGVAERSYEKRTQTNSRDCAAS
jgi:hypothetical protein